MEKTAKRRHATTQVGIGLSRGPSGGPFDDAAATSLGVTPPVAMFATKRRGGRRHIGRPARDHREDRAQKVLESAPALPMPVRTESGTATGDSPVGKGKSRIDTGKIG